MTYFIQKLTVLTDPAQLHSSSMPHHCKHVSSLSKSPPTDSGYSQYSFRPGCHLTISPGLHESRSYTLDWPCSGPIAALWVKGYVAHRGGWGGVSAEQDQNPEIVIETRLICQT